MKTYNITIVRKRRWATIRLKARTPKRAAQLLRERFGRKFIAVANVRRAA